MPIPCDVLSRVAAFILATLVTTHSLAADAPTGAKAIFAMNADSTGWRKFFQLPQMKELGPPAVSHDGQRLAFEGSAGFQNNSVFQNDSARTSHLFVVNTQRTEMRILGLGALPSWGPNDQQLACSFYAKGVGLLNVDSQELTWIDPLGWGTQWSPDGKDVAYVNGPELWFYEIAAKNKRQVLKGQPDYVQLLPNFAWPPDGKQIAIVGRKDHLVRDILLVSLADGKPQVTKRITGRMPGDKLAWHPTTPRLVFSETPFRNPPAAIVGGQSDNGRSAATACRTGHAERCAFPLLVAGWEDVVLRGGCEIGLNIKAGTNRAAEMRG